MFTVKVGTMVWVAGLVLVIVGAATSVYAGGGSGDSGSLISAFKCLADGNASCESFARAGAAAARLNWQLACLLAGLAAIWVGTAIRIITELRGTPSRARVPAR